MIVKKSQPINLELNILDLDGKPETNITSCLFSIYHRDNGVIVFDVESTEMSIDGNKAYYTINEGISVSGNYIINYIINNTYSQSEDLIVGYLEDDVKNIIDCEFGNWQILNNQMIFLKTDGSELMRFNLYDEDGKPSMQSIFKRVKV